MKKISILSTALMAVFTMSAQEAVVKDAEKAMKSGKTFEEVVSIIEPATKDATTSTLAITYYVPGKTAFKSYDDKLGKRQLGLYKAEDPKTAEIYHDMAKELVGGYDYFIKALSLDTVVDNKGKQKTKYSKEIVNTLVGHYNDYNTAALDFWNSKDYDGAYRAWDIFLNMPSVSALEGKLNVPTDTIVGEIMYNQALAAWQNNDHAAAVKSFRNAVEKGYTKQQVFEYGAAVAEAAKDMDSFNYFASQGSEFYPQVDNFINLLINYYLKSEKFDEALTAIDKAIASHPENAQYHALKGIIYYNKNELNPAVECYKKALELNKDNSLANFYYGVALNNQAGQLSDSYEGVNYDSYKEQSIKPLLVESAKYLENAYKLDKNIRGEALKILKNVYYNLNDAAGMKSVEERQLDD